MWSKYITTLVLNLFAVMALAGNVITYTAPNILPESTSPILYSATGGIIEYEPGLHPSSFDQPIQSHTFSNGVGTITFAGDLTRIGDAAFVSCSGMTSVTIPSSVTTIGQSAFAYCAALSELTLPEGVTTIGDDAFYRCSSLTSVVIPASLTSIGNSVFQSCWNLSSVTWNAVNCDYQPDVSSHLFPTGVTNFTFGDEVEQIPMRLCEYMTNLRTITLPSGVKRIGKMAFVGCTGLTSVTVPDSVTDIGLMAFSWCTGLTSISFPAGLSNVGPGVFSACSGLTSVSFPASMQFVPEEFLSSCSSLSSVALPSTITRIEKSAFRGCTSLSAISLPDSLKTIAMYAFEDCSGLTSLNIPDQVTEIAYRAFRNCTGLSTLVLGYGLQSLDKEAFSGCSSLGRVTYNSPKLYISALDCFGADVPEYIIGDSISNLHSIFSGCTGLTSVSLPNGLRSVNYSFDGCSGLTTIHLPAGLTHIGMCAFRGCTGLSKIDLPAGLLEIHASAFSACTMLDSVTIPDMVDWIDSKAFADCSGLTTLVLGCGLRTVTKNAFSGCSSLERVTYNSPKLDISAIDYFGADVPEYIIGDSISYLHRFFRGCSGLTSVSLPSGLGAIGNDAFSGCSALTEIDLPSGLTSIGSNAFYGCTGLRSLTIPDQVTKIDKNAFSGCSGLKSIDLPAGLTGLATGVFDSCRSLETITLPDSLVRIDSLAFSSCSSLARVTIPAHLTKVESNAFRACPLLNRVDISDLTAWCDIRFANEEANPLCNGADLYLNNQPITDLVIPDQVTRIRPFVFCHNRNLVTVKMHKSVREIGKSAFCSCPSLTILSVDGSSPATLGENAFDSCANLLSVVIPCGSYSSYSVAPIWQDLPLEEVAGLNLTIVSDTTRGVVTTDSEHFCYGDKVLLTAEPAIGYEFTRWSDGEIVNPRLLQVTCDTVVSAEFTLLRSGKCGDNLFWNYANGRLKIYGYGEMYDYSSTSPAPWFLLSDSIVDLSFDVRLRSIGDYAFYACNNPALNRMVFPEGLSRVGDYAFAGCSSIHEMECYTSMVPQAYTHTFEGVSTSTVLHVRAENAPAFRQDSVWGVFDIHDPSGLSSVPAQVSSPQKILHEGRIMLLKDNRIYDMEGRFCGYVE